MQARAVLRDRPHWQREAGLAAVRIRAGLDHGTWTLTVKDTQNSGDGILNDWSVVTSA